MGSTWTWDPLWTWMTCLEMYLNLIYWEIEENFDWPFAQTLPEFGPGKRRIVGCPQAPALRGESLECSVDHSGLVLRDYLFILFTYGCRLYFNVLDTSWYYLMLGSSNKTLNEPGKQIPFGSGCSHFDQFQFVTASCSLCCSTALDRLEGMSTFEKEIFSYFTRLVQVRGPNSHNTRSCLNMRKEHPMAYNKSATNNFADQVLYISQLQLNHIQSLEIGMGHPISSEGHP